MAQKPFFFFAEKEKKTLTFKVNADTLTYLKDVDTSK